MLAMGSADCRIHYQMLKECFIPENKNKKKKHKNSSENRKNEDKGTHPSRHARTPTHLYPHTHTFSLLFFSLLLCPLSASTLLLPVQRIVSSGHIMSPLSLSLSLCDQWGCLHSAGSTPSLKFNINPPLPPPPHPPTPQ